MKNKRSMLILILVTIIVFISAYIFLKNKPVFAPAAADNCPKNVVKQIILPSDDLISLADTNAYILDEIEKECKKTKACSTTQAPTTLTECHLSDESIQINIRGETGEPPYNFPLRRARYPLEYRVTFDCGCEKKQPTSIAHNWFW